MPTVAGSGLLLALAGLLEAAISVIYFVMFGSDGSATFHSWNAAVVLAGKLAIAAGACTIAAAIWKHAYGRSWLLAFNGLALGVLGLIQYGFTRLRISFLSVAILVILMAISASAFELLLAQTARRHGHLAYASFLVAAGAASAGLAVVFLALGLRWIGIEAGSHPDVFCLGVYFGCSAVGKTGLALRSGGAVLPLGSPRHAH